MALESACIPLPSEVIMPFAGALTLANIARTHGHAPMSLPLVALAGAIGCALGSATAYAVGATGGRDFILKYGRFVLLRQRDVERSEVWFQRYGPITVFVTRLLPVVRTFISLPAGIARMPFSSFLMLSFVGSLPWCFLLGWLGVKVGDNIEVLKKYFHGADAVIVIGLLALFSFWLWHHLRPEKGESPPTGEHR
jgi:membrane protein DedA with SNARE-associated domain